MQEFQKQEEETLCVQLFLEIWQIKPFKKLAILNSKSISFFVVVPLVWANLQAFLFGLEMFPPFQVIWHELVPQGYCDFFFFFFFLQW